jgi:catechol 2,3-dioxygenase-like lactoylglutathione lyase family enzyme
MINGAHVLIYSPDAEADRAFLRDVLNFESVDAGGGWLIFELPPAELGVHPGDGSFVQRHADHDLLGSIVYLMCDDLDDTIAQLGGAGVEFTDVQTAEWGATTTMRLPSGGALGLYQPSHPTPLKPRP